MGEKEIVAELLSKGAAVVDEERVSAFNLPHQEF
jgi:hypothetical protein